MDPGYVKYVSEQAVKGCITGAIVLCIIAFAAGALITWAFINLL